MAATNQNGANENVSQIAGAFAVLMATEYREICDNTNVKLIKKCILRNSSLKWCISNGSDQLKSSLVANFFAWRMTE